MTTLIACDNFTPRSLVQVAACGHSSVLQSLFEALLAQQYRFTGTVVTIRLMTTLSGSYHKPQAKVLSPWPLDAHRNHQ